MIIKNVQIFGKDLQFHQGDISIAEGKFISPGKENDEFIDGTGLFAIPGLIDIHFHGCKGDDFCDASLEGIERIAAYQASVGVTSICPASMTLPQEELHTIMRIAGEYVSKEHAPVHAKLVGINMEGPFISEVKKGAHVKEYIQNCDARQFRALQEASGGLIKLVDVAPDTEGALEFIAAVKDEVVVSLAHTAADYDLASKAFQTGARHVTHLYNAMPPFNHRDPGVIGAAIDAANCHVELICDGIHIHPTVVRATFAMFGPERVVLISDSMRATGLSDGQYSLGGQEVLLKDGKCTLEDGTIAGSSRNLMECLRIAVTQMNIPLEQAVAAATVNPAKAIGINDFCGSITSGKAADLVLLDQELNVKAVFVEGCQIQ